MTLAGVVCVLVLTVDLREAIEFSSVGVLAVGILYRLSRRRGSHSGR